MNNFDKKLAITLLATCVSAGSAQANTITWADTSDVYSMDPHGQAISPTLAFLHHIYEPLVRYNKDLEIEPALATGWEVIRPDLWRFSLREGVTFHNGNSFDADDVVASIKRATHQDSPIRGNLPAVSDVRKVDDNTVEIQLNGSYPLLLNDLTNVYILDKEWMTEHGTLNPVDPTQGDQSYSTTHTNGTGPFVLDTRRPDAETVLTVNDQWWDEAQHNLTRIEFTPIASDATRVSALLSGQIDMMLGVPLQDVSRLENAPGYRVLETSGLRTIMLALNQTPDSLHEGDLDSNPLRDQRVRKALYQSINMELIRDRLMRGKSRNTALPVAPAVPGYDASLDERFPYDPEAAQQLLAEAGYPNGFTVGLDCPNDRYVSDEEICQAIAAMWARVGIETRVNARNSSNHWQVALNGGSDIWMTGWATLPMLDSFSLLSQILSSPHDSYGAWNPGSYHNPEVDSLIEKIAVAQDEQERLAMISQAFELSQADIPMLPLHQQPLIWAANDNIQIPQTPDGKVRLWYTTVE
ncbi:ABC transporter substrate-binding protein [Halomonas stenophila]|uniref:Peptide/nickel transport system substrate-binding protein n=1 Tax=Halomonas stenophila TaxID=795312 RepID=A0A7W5EUT1_9GAMM|nr:ABC transporter substrate-binding protein [Halomonas stenophila]MBB3231457.1 peptide/nickel transport system substrate-binding protein [Halomonas stenophila]